MMNGMLIGETSQGYGKKTCNSKYTTNLKEDYVKKKKNN